MTSINISVKQDAYDFLKSLKAENKSFSDVILSFKSKEVMQFFGVLKHIDWKVREQEMQKLRTSIEQRLQ